MTKYKVLCGNIGTVLFSHSLEVADECFRNYVFDSKTNYGRAAGEDVVLFEDGEPIQEFFGSASR